MSDWQRIVGQVEIEVRNQLATQGAGHGFDHVRRVLAAARNIQAEEGGDRYVVELAALLHDVGDAKFHEGVERSGEISRIVLTDLSVDDRIIEHVVTIVDNISFRKRHEADDLSLEGKIVQDADRLDALGAIGIVRTIEYGAVCGQPFFDADAPDGRSGVRHFYDKLFHLRDLMNTPYGRRLAEEREQFMRLFLEQFFAECHATQSDA